MKKIFSNNRFAIQLVKGCPTDINGDGQENDDYNHDGNVDDHDQAFYDGYINEYFDWDFDALYENTDLWEAYQEGKERGNDDVHTEIFQSPDHKGPDIWQEDFNSVGIYY